MANPTPDPVPTVKVADWPARIAAGIAIALLCIQFYRNPLPLPIPGPDNPNPPASDAVTIGHDYGVVLPKTYASAWRKAADDVDAGKTIAEAQSNLQSTWAASRSAAGTRMVTPMFSAIIPEGEEGNAVSRAKWSKAARDFASGLETVK